MIRQTRIKKYFYAMLLILILNRWQFIQAQLRRMSGNDDGIAWGYINMLPYEGQFLNVTAIKTTEQPSKDNCVLDCIDIVDCWSINAIEQPHGSSFKCQLLSTDKHRNSTNYVALTGSTHFAIPSECDWEGACMNPRKQCVPDYSAGTYECVCPPGFDVNCLFKNLALGQNATMSSIADNSKPEFAVDGIYNRKEGCIKMASSGHARHNWLRIDFGGWKHVGFVEIHNRNYNGNLDVMRRISNSFVYVYGESPTENRQLCAEIVDGGFKVFNLPCIKTLYGKGLELYQTDLGYDRWLHVCEIIVLGY